MPPDSVETQDKLSHDLRRKGQYVLVGVLLLVLLGLGGWQWYLKNKLADETQADFYNALSKENTAFADAEKLAINGNFSEAIPLYQTALQATHDDKQRLKITLILARAMVQTGDYAHAIPLLKQVITMSTDPVTARGRATAAEEIADLYSQRDTAITNAIFSDQPFTALLVEGDAGLTLRQLHEYAVSIYPIATAELRVAKWYSAQLPNAGKKSVTINAAQVDQHVATIHSLLGTADYDINFMQADGTMGHDFRTAILLRAGILGDLNRFGDTSIENAEAQFLRAIDAFTKTGPGQDGIARYYYALFLAQTYGAEKKAQIQTILAPLSTSEYAASPVITILKNARAVASYRKFPKLIATIDPDFKAYLMSLGWTPEDFSS